MELFRQHRPVNKDTCRMRSSHRLDRIDAAFDARPPSPSFSRDVTLEGSTRLATSSATRGRRTPRRSRRIAWMFAGLLGVGLTQACGSSMVPLDTLANNSAQAENVASSV